MSDQPSDLSENSRLLLCALLILPLLNLRWISRRVAFTLPRRKPQPSCRLRMITESDHATCEEIFRLNAPLHFPPDQGQTFNAFKAWLREDSSLIIVAECDGVVRGLGGINVKYFPATDRRVAYLVFGMVHPDHHRRGLGTALLMCRLSLLPPDHLPMSVCMISAGASYRFYKRFGFRYFASDPSAHETPLDCYHVPLTRADRVLCEYSLATDQVDRTLLIGARTGRFKALDPPAAADNPVPK